MREAGVLIAVVVTMFSASTMAEPLPAEAYGRLPAIESAAISPDGSRVAMTLGFEYQPDKPGSTLSALRIVNVESGKIEHTLAPPPGNAMLDVGWADEDRVYYTLSESVDLADEYSRQRLTRIRNTNVVYARAYVLSRKTGTTTPMMGDSEFRSYRNLANLIVPIEGDPGFGRIVIAGGTNGVSRRGRISLLRVNLDNGKASDVASMDERAGSFILDERANVVARTGINPERDLWRLYVNEGGKERLLLEQETNTASPLRLYGLLADGRIAAVDAREEGERDTMLAIDRKTGASTALYKTEGSDIGPVRDPWTRGVVGVAWTDDLPKQHYFDEQLRTIHESLQPQFADGFVRIVSWSRDRARVLAFGEHADDAGAYYLYEPKANKLRLVGKRYPALRGIADLGERRAIRFRARDGVLVPAYLTLPVGVEPKQLPLVLLVHSGPHARNNFTFNWWASFLASRGYAVLDVNFRGSSGYGYEWLKAGHRGWGTGVMQTDVEDGADALVKAGMVDATRVCIMGVDYGGYAAAAGAALTPKRYACAVSINGMVDIVRLYNDGMKFNRRGLTADWWRTTLGDDIGHLRRISPIENVHKIEAPILLIHVESDPSVPVEDSRSFNAKLAQAGKQVRYVEIKGPDYSLSSAATRTHSLREVETFLAETLGKKNDVE